MCFLSNHSLLLLGLGIRSTELFRNIPFPKSKLNRLKKLNCSDRCIWISIFVFMYTSLIYTQNIAEINVLVIFVTCHICLIADFMFLLLSVLLFYMMFKVCLFLLELQLLENVFGRFLFSIDFFIFTYIAGNLMLNSTS